MQGTIPIAEALGDAPAGPKLELPPPDEALPGLPHLFDYAWVWEALCGRFGRPEETPQRLRIRQFTYRPGRHAVVTYVAEREWDRWIVEDQFAIELAAGEPERIFRYPDDPYLPGLPAMASAPEAHDLLAKHVPLHPQRLHVEAVRYRPTRRAVLRHRISWRRGGIEDVTLYARVMRPERVPRLLAAAELAERSGFVLPRLAGVWPEGGVVWLARSPGETVRKLIRSGQGPDPEPILDGLAQLWSTPVADDAASPADVRVAFRSTERLLSKVIQGEEARETLQRVLSALRPFAESWRPSAIAHNDFYDDQLLLAPNGRFVLVDFEETGPGDPLLDVGNLLAHQRWMARFGKPAEACSGYRRRFREAALGRFAWDERALALREAFALLRLSTNPLRMLRPGWPQATEAGLQLALDALAETA